MAGRKPGHPKTGGKLKGSKNKPKPLILDDTPENRALVLAAPTAKVLTPKSAMMAAMQYYYDLAQDMMRARNQDGINKAWSACLAVAKELAPFVHPRLLAVESRGVDGVAPIPFVLRAPSTMEDSAQWQAIASQQAAVLDQAEREAVQEALQERWREREATREPPIVENAPATMPHPAMPRDSAAETLPATLVADPNTGRVTIMPVGPRVVQPSGTEWLESIKNVGNIKLAR